MSGKIYKNPISFAIMTIVAISVGTLLTMLLPMLSPTMHPRLEKLRPFTPLELAGRDIYQREGCNNCHTQTVRPLKTEVLRYGDYSKAGEFAYDQPHLWGSKRTGPDLARQAYKFPAEWHYMHFDDPASIEPESNMPRYDWLKGNPLNASSVESHMRALSLPIDRAALSDLSGKNEMDALVAYMLWLGHAVPPVAESAEAAHMDMEAYGDHEALEHRGEEIFEQNCSACHGLTGEGGIGPSLQDIKWLGVSGDVPNSVLFTIVTGGTQPGMIIGDRKAKGGMPTFGNTLSKKDVWSVIAYIRLLEKNAKK